MYSKKQSNVTQNTRNHLVLVALFSTVFLSACGIKGDLYQTPAVDATETSPQEQPSQEPDKTSEPAQGLSEENPSVLTQE
jgi:predicted small lipoprotein YifL